MSEETHRKKTTLIALDFFTLKSNILAQDSD